MRLRPLIKSTFKALIASSVLLTTLLSTLPAKAEVINIPLQRSIATQPITKLEVIATVKGLLNGRVLAVRKQSTYTNPDCFHVKFLEDRGEFHMIQLGCSTEKVVQREP